MAIRNTSWKLNIPSKPEEYDYIPDEQYKKDFPSIQEVGREESLKTAGKEKERQAIADLLKGWKKV